MELRGGIAMRFHRSDIPGLLIAVVGPVGLMLVFLASFETWDHHGTPLLGAMAGNLAVGAGLIAAFSRYIRNWDAILGLVLILVVSAGLVITLQQTGDGSGGVADTFKWVAVVAFLALNVLVPLQYLTNGFIPWFNRREAARAAAESEA